MDIRAEQIVHRLKYELSGKATFTGVKVVRHRTRSGRVYYSLEDDNFFTILPHDDGVQLERAVRQHLSKLEEAGQVADRKVLMGTYLEVTVGEPFPDKPDKPPEDDPNVETWDKLMAE